MYNNLAGHSLYYGAAPLGPESDTPNDSIITKGIDTDLLATSVSPSRKQVLWLIAPNPVKEHWMHLSSSSSVPTSNWDMPN